MHIRYLIDPKNGTLLEDLAAIASNHIKDLPRILTR